ncbi:MAG: undecaprenyl-diphosphate phosphatase [Oscillospiraceae bacterium]|nr:undecaprenyl-diphosphate phosphatase [Oscillospiraceae bacterium]
MTILMSILLGIIQGIAEFIPVSGSGHFAIIMALFDNAQIRENNAVFMVFMHLATLISICVAFRKEIGEMISDSLEYLRDRGDSVSGEAAALKPPARTTLFVIIGTLPMLIALIFRGRVEALMLNTAFVGFALIATGALLIVTDKYIKRGSKSEKTMQLADALLIGLAQVVATLPGFSRSGTTIAVGLARGFSGSFAVKFSLLLSIPTVFGGVIFYISRAVSSGAGFSLFGTYLIGFAIATVIGFFAIQILRRILAKGGFGKIAFYCLIVGAVTLIISLIF